MANAEKRSSEQLSKRPARSLNAALWFLAALVVLIAAFVVVNSGPPRLWEGEIVSDLGEYRSPHDKVRVRVSKTPDGNIQLVFRRSFRWFYIFRTFQDSRVIHFEHERGWFLCFDASDELWLFHGQWKREWGRLRTLPSGGTRPYAATVFRFSGTRGSCLSSHFDWHGVPAEFLERILDADESVWGPNHVFLPDIKRPSRLD